MFFLSTWHEPGIECASGVTQKALIKTGDE
jgi:hypothetical protein